MFEAIEKETGKRLTVYATNAERFLVADGDGGFVYRSMGLFAPVTQEDTVAPVAATPCVFSAVRSETTELDKLLAGIASGEIAVSLGSAISTRLVDGTEVDFVVTDYDDETIRFESRDCLGMNTSALGLDSYLEKVYELMPAALKRHVVETERVHLDSDGEMFTKRCKLFAPAASEIFPPDECYGDENLYQQMEWYKDVHNRIRAFEKGGNSCWYWTSSPYTSSANWCFVNYYGDATYYYASSPIIAAPVCFRIRRIK